MFRNFIIIAFRILFRHRIFSLINVAGLAVGLTGAILILLYVQDELSYDRFHDHADQIFRVGLYGTNQGNEISAAVTGIPMAPVLARDYPEVLSATRLFTFVEESTVKYGENSFLEERFFYADSSFFGVFGTGLLRGDPATVLARANTVVITDEMARKYFGEEDPMGKVIKVGIEGRAFEVTGIVKKYPGNAHLKFDFLGSLESTGFARSPFWMSYVVYTYVRLADKNAQKPLESKFPDMVMKYVGPQWEQVTGTNIEESFGRGVKYGFFLQPITDIHLDPDLEGEPEPGGNPGYISIFSLIALLLIVVASINFMNLTTAQSATRAREVGIRKAYGSTRSILLIQFMTESLLLSFIALVIGVLLTGSVLPYFNELAGKDLTISVLHYKFLVPALLVLGLFVGILSGSYPGLYLSSLQPVMVLKGKAGSGPKRRNLRGILVVFQLSVSIFLFICTLVVSRQMNFVQRIELGYDKSNLLVVNGVEALHQQKDVFKEELSKNADVIQSGYTNTLPNTQFINSLFRQEGASAGSTHNMDHWLVDFDLQATLDLEMAEGRWFSRDFLSDTLGAVINESAAEALGMEDPLGQSLLFLGGAGEGDIPLKIIGILKDFHYESIHQAIHPLVMTFLPPQYAGYLIVRIQPQNFQRTVSLINRTWKAFVPEQPFEYSFLEDDLVTAYHDDFRTGKLYSVFSVLAIFISVLGLIGLASYSAVQRTKEIGVRKVLGAHVPVIIRMLSGEVFMYIGIATVITWPLGYFFMKSWLQNFAFRVEPGLLSFLLASLLALIVAGLTVGLRAFIAATANPADSLRYE